MLGSKKLVHYSAVAGERALAAHGYEEAEAHYERALRGKEGQPMSAAPAPISERNCSGSRSLM